MRRALWALLGGGVLASAVPAAPAPEVLAQRTVTQAARTLAGQAAGEVHATVQLVRQGDALQARASLTGTLTGPAVVNGTLRLVDGNGQELTRSNPRQLAPLRAGQAAELVTPTTRATGEAPCVDAQLTVWSGAQAPGQDAAPPRGPELRPTVFALRLCPP
ncbi:hypothetical protein [Deinococcus kurensis]|uniref:hypothetical protein n=1 Tax=Deinococcus kurensis TaxID=2662757 RepID=UPI0012D3339F|nr:hypothetical protein [Deinococcus kurensis]